jgi:hypothetical protein
MDAAGARCTLAHVRHAMSTERLSNLRSAVSIHRGHLNRNPEAKSKPIGSFGKWRKALPYIPQ